MREDQMELDVGAKSEEIKKIVDDTFIDLWNAKAKEIHTTAKDKGWWDKPRNEGEIIALMHSELSEALEAIREEKKDDKITDFLGVEAELADVVIRLMDYALYHRYRVAEAIIAKMEFNKGRKRMHGGKKF